MFPYFLHRNFYLSGNRDAGINGYLHYDFILISEFSEIIQI